MASDADRIIAALPVENYIGRFVALKRKGNNLWGLCPFHGEKTPSFSVSPQKGIYKCFGCGVGGNVITFAKEYNKLSFVEALKLLAEFPEVRAKWQAALGHVLVDEYQDTNATQYEVLKHLVGERGRFTAVGDDDQSIYGWRGATLDNLKKLPIDFPQLKVIKLEQNYRSTSAILRAANNVIGPNPKLFPKTLFSELGEGEPVRVVDADNEDHEAERAVARIQSIRNNGSAQAWKSFAVLYRANHQAKVFEQALRKAQIPYKVSGGQSFFDRAEIKDLCAWFRLWVNNDDDPAFLILQKSSASKPR